MSRLIRLITSGSCLENSSDFKHCLGVNVEATVEPGYRVKSQCYRHLENIHVLTADTLTLALEKYPQKIVL